MATTPTTTVDLSEVLIEPHGERKVIMTHRDFRRRMLDKYGRCTNVANDVVAVECTCKATASHDTVEQEEMTVVYGLSTVKFKSLLDLTVEAVNECYMDAALDATKRLSTCIDIYYKNKDAGTKHDTSGDGESERIDDSVEVSFNSTDLELEVLTPTVLGPIIVTGDVSGEISITITPKNATLKGFKSDPSQVVNSDMVYELPVHTLAAINNELSALEIKPLTASPVYIELRKDTALLKTISINVQPQTDITATMSNSTAVATVESAVSPIVFTGVIAKPVDVTIVPHNCSITGFLSKPGVNYVSGNSYTFSGASLTALNNELANLKVLASAEGTCQIDVKFLDKTLVFSVTVNPAPTNDIDVTLDVSDPLMENTESSIAPLVFTGNVEKEFVTVKVTPVNATFKNVASAPSVVFTSTTPYIYTASDASELSTEFANLKVTPLSRACVRLDVTIDDNDPIEFSFNVQPKPVQELTVSYTAMSTPIELNATANLNPIVLSGDTDGVINISLTPKNATLRGFKMETTKVVNSDTRYELPVHTIAQINNELSALKVTPTAVENVSIEIRLDEKLLRTISLTVSDITELTVTMASAEVEANVESAIPPIVCTGSVNRTIEVKVVPHNCSVAGFASRPTVNYNDGIEYVFMTNTLSAINTELASLKVFAATEGTCSINVVALENTTTLEITVNPQ